MATEILKDRDNNRIGEIRDNGNEKILYDRHGNRLGKFSNGYTYDIHGNKIGSGNLLVTLLNR